MAIGLLCNDHLWSVGFPSLIYLCRSFRQRQAELVVSILLAIPLQYDFRFSLSTSLKQRQAEKNKTLVIDWNILCTIALLSAMLNTIASHELRLQDAS